MLFGGHSVYEKHLELGRQALGVGILRQQVIANNIANVDTPHYKRHRVSFESELNRAITEASSPRTPTKITDTRHIHFDPRVDPLSVKPRIDMEYDTNYRNDENNVDIEKEVADQVKNTLHFSAVTQSMTHSFQRLRSVLV